MSFINSWTAEYHTQQLKTQKPINIEMEKNPARIKIFLVITLEDMYVFYYILQFQQLIIISDYYSEYSTSTFTFTFVKE